MKRFFDPEKAVECYEQETGKTSSVWLREIAQAMSRIIDLAYEAGCDAAKKEMHEQNRSAL